MLHVRSVRGVGREQAQRFFARQLFLRIPAARRLAIAVLARDRRVQAVEWIRELDREVAAARESHLRVEQLAPGIGALDALRSDAVFRHVHIGRRVRRLDRGDHFEPREPADVVERDDLRVLDPRAQRVTLLFRQQGFERVEHEPIAGVTDRVHVQLPALGRGQRRELLHLLARVHHQPAVVRLIACSPA